jgi:hypothetical protein
MSIQADSGAAERRKQPHIREVFDRAYRIAYPLLASHGGMGGAHSHSMLHQVLHNHFPDLHKQDVPILAAALTRVFREHGQNAPR